MKVPTIILSITAIFFSSCTPPPAPVEVSEPSSIDTSIPYGVTQTYVGKVGSKSAIFALTWGVDGNVAGQYSHPGDAASVYQLKGKNTRDGELVLTEYTTGRQSAMLTLRKSVSSGLIQWKGTMHNTDGRVIPVSMTRQAD